MTHEAISAARRRIEKSEISQIVHCVAPSTSTQLTNSTSTCLARIADLQADAARTALADATVAARELSMTITPAQLIFVWFAQLQRGAARVLDLDAEIARAAGALQTTYHHALQSHAADWLHHLMQSQRNGFAAYSAAHQS